jgi:hypothetical protein
MNAKDTQHNVKLHHETEQRLLNQSVYNPLQGQFGTASPTSKIVDINK